MRKGEKGVLIFIACVVLLMMGWNAWKLGGRSEQDTEIPFYSDASPELRAVGSTIYRKYQCKRCHSLWTVKDIMRTVPAPALDGIGSLRDEQWLYNYLSSPNPQEILSSRLKEEYKMPSYHEMPEQERRQLAGYLASLKVKDWYLDDAKKAECRKLTGGEC